MIGGKAKPRKWCYAEKKQKRPASLPWEPSSTYLKSDAGRDGKEVHDTLHSFPAILQALAYRFYEPDTLPDASSIQSATEIPSSVCRGVTWCR